MSLTSVKTVSALVAGGAAALALSALYRGSGRDADPVTAVAHSAHEAALAERSAAPARTGSSASDATTGAPAGPTSNERELARQAELHGASESFRNSTLLTTIRENGHECAELTSVAASEVALSDRTPPDPLGGWRVACRGALAYFVAVGRGGQLVVEPLPIGDYPVTPGNQLPQNQLPNPLSPPNPPQR
jgi:hypothetical protein